ncbi:MAG: carbon-nitrogen hydrolase family protein [Gammaproteobacteria bacterium]|nr:carbon-nitrogen hydrolase family protein [Gammaproteobacteria bacterium]
MNDITVAAIQLRSSDDIKENIATVSALIRQANDQGAQFIATPEITSLVDCRPGMLAKKSCHEEDDQALAAFSQLAAELKIWLLIGSIPIRSHSEKCVNRSFLLGPNGDIVARYDKIHLFDISLGENETYLESARYNPGDDAVIAQVDNLKLGMTVCYDVRFPHLFRDLSKAGAQLITVPAAFARTTGKLHWHVLMRARAIETSCFVIAPAQGGKHTDGRETYGHSLIVDPWGQILAEAPGDEPGVIVSTLNLEQVDEVRQKMPMLAHDRDYALSHH